MPALAAAAASPPGAGLAIAHRLKQDVDQVRRRRGRMLLASGADRALQPGLQILRHVHTWSPRAPAPAAAAAGPPCGLDDRSPSRAERRPAASPARPACCKPAAPITRCSSNCGSRRVRTWSPRHRARHRLLLKLATRCRPSNRSPPGAGRRSMQRRRVDAQAMSPS